MCLFELNGQDYMREALMYYKNKDYINAAEKINLAIQENDTSALLWHYKAYIFKELYKTGDTSIKDSRMQGIDASEKCIQLSDEGEANTANKCRHVLNYLATSQYNDAVRAFDQKDYSNSLKYFRSFKRINDVYGFKKDGLALEISYYRGLVTNVYNPLYEFDEVKYAHLADSIIKTYKYILQLDPNNFNTLYSLGAFHNNQAVNLVREANVLTTDLAVLDSLIEVMVELFNTALPYFQKAQKIQQAYEKTHNPPDPEAIEMKRKKEILTGLLQAYKSLNMEDSVRKYTIMIQSISNAKERALNAFQEAVTTKDKEALSEFMDFPISVNYSGEKFELTEENYYKPFEMLLNSEAYHQVAIYELIAQPSFSLTVLNQNGILYVEDPESFKVHALQVSDASLFEQMKEAR